MHLHVPPSGWVAYPHKLQQQLTCCSVEVGVPGPCLPGPLQPTTASLCPGLGRLCPETHLKVWLHEQARLTSIGMATACNSICLPWAQARHCQAHAPLACSRACDVPLSHMLNLSSKSRTLSAGLL